MTVAGLNDASARLAGDRRSDPAGWGFGAVDLLLALRLGWPVQVRTLDKCTSKIEKRFWVSSLCRRLLAWGAGS